MKPHPVLRIDLVSAMLVVAFHRRATLFAHRGCPKHPKWEYQIVGCGVGCSGQVAHINKLGDEDWEVVTLNASNRILLKRAK